MELRFDEEYVSLVPAMTKEEFEELVQDIYENGQHYDIIVNPDGIVLDGRHRFLACQQLGLECRYQVRELPDRLHEKKFIIESNLHRRNLTTWQKVELGEKLLEIERELAKGRQSEAGKLGMDIRHKVASRDATLEDAGKATEKVAKKVGISHTTLERAIKIKEKGTPEEIEKVRVGEEGIKPTYEKIIRRERVEEEKEKDKEILTTLMGSEEEAERVLEERKQDKYLKMVEDTMYRIMGWSVPLVYNIGIEKWSDAIRYITLMRDRLDWLLRLVPELPEDRQPNPPVSEIDSKRIIEAEYQIIEGEN